MNFEKIKTLKLVIFALLCCPTVTVQSKQLLHIGTPKCHADPLLAESGMLKVGDLYRQQLRVHGWRFWNGRLPVNQAALLGRTGSVHGHATRAAATGLYLSSRDHRSVGYRVPKEWASLTETQRRVGSLAAFKRGSKGEFLGAYRAFECGVGNCGACGRMSARPHSVGGEDG